MKGSFSFSQSFSGNGKLSSGKKGDLSSFLQKRHSSKSKNFKDVLFNKIDSDGNGELSKSELKTASKKLLGHKCECNHKINTKIRIEKNVTSKESLNERITNFRITTGISFEKHFPAPNMESLGFKSLINSMLNDDYKDKYEEDEDFLLKMLLQIEV